MNRPQLRYVTGRAALLATPALAQMPDMAAMQRSCGNNLKTYKGATKEAREYIAPPDPQVFAKSIVMTAQNNQWVWTFTPTPK